MLFYKTITPEALDILRKLQASPSFNKLRLAGGTAFALQIGHRKSVDIDLFGELKADYITISKTLKSLGDTVVLSNSENIHVFSVNGVKVDIVNYPYPWLSDAICDKGIKIAGQKDIAAMKLAAITNRGTKKDFIDIYFLLQKFSLCEMLEFYSKKFPDGSPFLVLKSLAYFEDAEEDPMPNMIKKITWRDIKSEITEALKKYLASSCHSGSD